MLPLQLDAPLCVGNAGAKSREGSGHSNLTHPFVGNAGGKFREGCGHSNLTHPCGQCRGKILDKEVVIPTGRTLLWAMQA